MSACYSSRSRLCMMNTPVELELMCLNECNLITESCSANNRLIPFILTGWNHFRPNMRSTCWCFGIDVIHNRRRRRRQHFSSLGNREVRIVLSYSMHSTKHRTEKANIVVYGCKVRYLPKPNSNAKHLGMSACLLLCLIVLYCCVLLWSYYGRQLAYHYT